MARRSIDNTPTKDVKTLTASQRENTCSRILTDGNNKGKFTEGREKMGEQVACMHPDKKNIYLGIHATIADAVNPQEEYRKKHGLPDPKIGRLKKEKKP